jgi:RimJ/RimL family protein N-acetyltransferase
MPLQSVVLTGKYIRLEPLDRRHADGLAAASVGDLSLYQWSPVPQGKEEALRYIDIALAAQDAGTALPFAIVKMKRRTSSPGYAINADDAKQENDLVIGSTRFFDIERWAWPPAHASHGRTFPDACEIGYTWLARSAIRTAANTEGKLLMLTHAFETWQVLRVCLHTDARNHRSRAAIERIGGRFEGILRSHRMAADFIARDSARFSIVVAEWPEVKQRLTTMLNVT